MKTLENLSEAERKWLEFYTKTKARALTQNLVEEGFELGKKIHESLQPEQWEPKTLGIWRADSSCRVRESIDDCLDGYSTEQEAQRVAELRKPLELLNRRIREENKRTEFVANYNDRTQDKYYIVFNHASNDYSFSLSTVSEKRGIEVCTIESAQIICKELNDGVIKL